MHSLDLLRWAREDHRTFSYSAGAGADANRRRKTCCPARQHPDAACLLQARRRAGERLQPGRVHLSQHASRYGCIGTHAQSVPPLCLTGRTRGALCAYTGTVTYEADHQPVGGYTQPNWVTVRPPPLGQAIDPRVLRSRAPAHLYHRTRILALRSSAVAPTRGRRTPSPSPTSTTVTTVRGP